VHGAVTILPWSSGRAEVELEVSMREPWPQDLTDLPCSTRLISANDDVVSFRY
jgi:hypothetical protein